MNKTAAFYGVLITIIVLALIVSANLNKTPELKPKYADLVENQIMSADTSNSFGQNLHALHGIHSRDQLMNVMRGFTEALGVKCDYCHNTDNFPSDEKVQKRMARLMIKMVGNIDHDYLNAPQMEKVSCFTCHRGSTTPKMTLAK
ncbi:MAG TPA: c-type cytochrome [Candidatus Kryptonia bacterium]